MFNHCYGILQRHYNLEGDLGQLINKYKLEEKKFSEWQIQNFFIQICFSIEYIHRRRIIHRDIKPSNIFLPKQDFVKLGDFGISKVLENSLDSAMTILGTPYYLSPELCKNKPYNFKTDIWSLGCLLYEMCELKVC